MTAESMEGNVMTNRIVKGVFAGFIGTLALSALMILKAAMGLMPQMNAIKMLTVIAHGMLGTPLTPVVGWLLHFMIGSLVWGVSFSLLFERLPSHAPILKGLIFGTAAWVLMMIVVMPMAGAGLFGLYLGLGTPIATLVLHWAYGAVLGGVYGRLGATRLVTGHPHA
jgi:hypothetical protein